MLTYQNATVINVPASLVETNVPTKVVGTTTKRNFIFPQVVGTVVPTMIVGIAVPTKVVGTAAKRNFMFPQPLLEQLFPQ